MVGLPARDITRTTLAVLFLAGLIGASVWVLLPFLPALVWATMLVVATWPAMLRAEALLGGRRGLAVAVMTLALVVALAVPLFLAIATIVRSAPTLIDWSHHISELPPPPGWLESLPLAGGRLAERWREIGALEPEEVSERITPYVAPAVRWFVDQIGSLALVVAHVLLTGILAALLYARGEAVVDRLNAFTRRLAGPRGERAVQLAGRAIRAVALGVVGTALIQSILAGLGLAVAGVPYAGLLTVLMFLLGVAQVGPVPVLLGASAWLWWKEGAAFAVALLVWTVLVGGIDNVLRPLLIRRGAGLPLLLIFAGVLGGLLAFGLIGLFIGPVLLAVSYTLLVDWLAEPASPQGFQSTP